ncbi:acyl-ACP--UDP-N-acetylglucosamine O-acyltransferase [Desulfovermiculus halophilus]|uniref:acyl-ACP--UDP-N-acetylglucosamine O-acyltransferase n=1 Tax=Desulfovermiculus halophilus TaxID=339722 RepID=UPI00048808DF|nr:acyl-ACP--UDP-N-acetylglucosamine O-acyltransferase [Desulfovermiculus halophilus]
MNDAIHPTAIIHPQAELGQSVSVGAYAIVEQGVEIGEGSKIEPFARIQGPTTLGTGNHIHSHACIGGPPQDLKYNDEPTVLEIGDDNTIREYVTIHRGTVGGGGVTKMGSRCLIMAYAHIAHDCILGDEVILANAATLAGHVTVHNKAVVGGLSAVHQFVRIGESAYIGGMTGVAQDVPPFMLVAGERGWLHGLNLVGLRRQGFTRDELSTLKQAYQIIWRSGMRRTEALQEVKRELDTASPRLAQLVEFVESSSRGIIGPKGMEE